MTCILLDTASDISLNKSAQCSSFPITRVCSTGVVCVRTIQSIRGKCNNNERCYYNANHSNIGNRVEK